MKQHQLLTYELRRLVITYLLNLLIIFVRVTKIDTGSSLSPRQSGKLQQHGINCDSIPQLNHIRVGQLLPPRVMLKRWLNKQYSREPTFFVQVEILEMRTFKLIYVYKSKVYEWQAYMFSDAGN